MSRHHLKLDRARWARTRLAVFRRDRYRCRGCGHPGGLFECDHVVPLDRDPDQNPYDPAGCQTLCVPCHVAKTRGENRRELTPAEREWANLVDAMRSAP